MPLKPERWLTLSTEGVSEGDFAMMLGFPGSTHKYYTSWEVEERRDIDNDVRIRMREVRQQAMLEEMLSDPAVKIQYASKYSGSTNAYKNAIGTNWAINLRDFEQVKRDQQNRLLEWAERNNQPQYAEALQQIEAMVKEQADGRYRSWMLSEGISRGVEFASVPRGGWSRLNKVMEEIGSRWGRRSRYKEELEGACQQLIDDYARFANKDYNASVDRKVSVAMITEYIRLLDREKQPAYFKLIDDQFNGDVEAFVNHIFDHSLFGNPENFERFKSDPRAYLSKKKKPDGVKGGPHVSVCPIGER